MREIKPGWSLSSQLIEIHWKRGGPEGLFADRVRINGTVFHYLSGKKQKARSKP